MTPVPHTVDRPHVLLLQGPNMNYLGKRQPELYGRTTAAELDAVCMAHAEKIGLKLSIFYSNSEGAALDRIYKAVEEEQMAGIVMNPAAWSVGAAGTSMRYCLMSVDRPYVEVHLRNQYVMKNVSTLADLAVGVVQGFGINSYILGLDAIKPYVTAPQASA